MKASVLISPPWWHRQRVNVMLASLGACLVISILLTFPDMLSLNSGPDEYGDSDSPVEESMINMQPQEKATSLFTNATMLPSQPRHVNDIFWCEASREGSMPEGKSFHHFPHAMIFMGRCWSWFLEKNAYPGRCGFLLDAFSHKRLLEKANTDWVVTIFETTGCLVRVVEPPIANLSSLHHNYYTPDLWPQNKLYKHIWVDKPEHAWKLRDLLLQRQQRVLPQRITKIASNSSVVRIGFLDRFETRSIANLDDLVRRVSLRYDRVVLDKAWFTSTAPMLEQLAWFASHDIIVGAHGAAMTNCMFLQAGTIVIEIFPMNYFPLDFFGSLITQVAAIHVPLYADGSPLVWKDPAATRLNLQEGVAAFKDNSKRREERHGFRSVNITVRVDDVIYLLDRALKRITGRAVLFVGTEKYDALRKQAYLQRVQNYMNRSISNIIMD
jgi:hypothetical protein